MEAIFPSKRGWKVGIRPMLIAVCFIAVGCLPGCDYLPFGYTKIGEIVAKGAQFEGREVKIRGKVMDANKIPLLDIKSYSLRDDTGTITVFTPGSLPVVGQEIGIRGIAQNMLVVGGQSFGLTLKETTRLPTLWPKN